MGLLDRLPGEGRRGVTVAVATGVVALMAAGLLAWLTWGRDGDPSAAVPPPVSAPAAVTVVSRGGGFSLTVPGDLTGTRLGRNVRVATADQTLLVTVGPGPRTSVARAQRSALAAIRDTYGKVRVADSVSTRLGGLPARRAVGTLVRKDGGPLVFSVTTGAQGRRTWSVIMFATRDVTAEDLDRWYQPVLDGFRLT
jgi:hypothetical protein